MAINIKCKCGKMFKAKDEHAGKRFPCPQCGTTLQVPRPAPGTPGGGTPPTEAKR